MQVELYEFQSVLNTDESIDSDAAVAHAVIGLAREGLLAEAYSIGPKEIMPPPAALNTEFENLISVRPTTMGVELYGWAQGLPGLSPGEFVIKAEVFDRKIPFPDSTRSNFHCCKHRQIQPRSIRYIDRRARLTGAACQTSTGLILALQQLATPRIVAQR